MMENIQELIDGNKRFRDTYVKENSDKLHDLVKNGQDPVALFIGCSDSRVVPNLMTDSFPGDLFVVRNVGNFVAPYKPDETMHSTAAAIEYAVSALKVPNIIVCGHTHCGAIATVHSGIDGDDFVHIKKWLTLGEKAKTQAVEALGEGANKEELLRLTEKLSVVTQIENLMTYPSVDRAVKSGTLQIHGWVYDKETGQIEY